VPHIEDFARLNFEYVLLSKRKLQKLVELKKVDGWNDPRFPTVQGILRRGMTVEALREFILSQGASKSLNLMTMDKLWALNKKLIDPVAPRYTAVSSARVPITLTNAAAEPNMKSVPRHKKNPELGNKVVTYQNRILIDSADASEIKDNEEVTLMDWGNALIKSITKDANGTVTALEAELHLAGDFKSTEKKLTWLADTPDLIPIIMREYSYVITKKKLEEDDDFEKYINPLSLVETTGVADPALRTINQGDKIQLERKGFYIVDSPFTYPDHPLILVQIPDGRPIPMPDDKPAAESKKTDTGDKKGKKKPAEKTIPEDHDKIKKAITKVNGQLIKWKAKKTEKDENKAVSLTTSKINYIDPRISVAWAKRYDVPIEKIFSKTLREKFPWAMDVDDDWMF